MRTMRLPIPDKVIDRQIEDLRVLLDKVSKQPHADGHYLTASGSEDITLVNGAVNKLPHRLGRKIRGWEVKDLRGATSTGRIVRVTSSGGVAADDTTDLWLDVQGHGANIIVRLWVE